MRKLVLLAMALSGTALAAEKEKSLEERVEALEFASYASSISWSGYFQTRYDYLTIKQDGQPDQHQVMHRLLGGIDFKANPHEKFSVFGRVAFGKFYNNNPLGVPGTSGTFSGARRYADDGKAYIERFFINYTPIDWFTFTAGRLPTVDGPPRHILDGRPRLGTYPSQVYAVSLDGYALTFNPKIGDNQSLSLRYVLSPLSFMQVSSTQNSVNTNIYENIPTGVPGKENASVRDLNSWMADYSLTGTSVARNIGLVYQGLKFENLGITPALRMTVVKHAAYIELEDIAQIGLTAYVSYTTSDVKSKGALIVPGAPFPISALTNAPNGSEKGHGVIGGLSYKLPVDALKTPSLGVEYVEGSKYYINFERTSDEAFSFYDVRGTAGQVYYLQPLLPGLTVRVGYQQAKPD
ncbi:MAG: DUF3373 family protein [Proteobacteria bacterium]|nr:MAG: DUF3373 family protein [Pseudomonadota bacterium]